MGMWNLGGSIWQRQDENSGMYRYFKENFNLSSFAPDMVERVKQKCNELISLQRFREMYAAARKVQNSDATNVVRQLETIGQFQFANEALQPFLIAMPEYRQLYNNNMATGFENGYSKVDRFRGSAYMHTDDNYREVTSGMSTEYDEDRIWTWVSNEDRSNRLTRVQQVDMQINWARMRSFDWEDEDPCSELGASC